VRTTLAKVTQSHTSFIQCSAIQHDREHNLVTYSSNSQNPSIPCTSWDTGHQHPHQLKITPTTPKYMATTHPAYIPHHYTQTTYHSIYFHTPQNGQDPPRLGAHTHQPIDHAHQEASKTRLTSPLQTTSSTDCILTVLLLTLKPMNVMVFEISTSNCISIF
jgi:hypothetical protein